MIRDTEDVVARVTRFAETLSVNRHYMTGQTCMEVQDAVRALLADRQSLSDRIDDLERERSFVWRWVERGLFDATIDRLDALKTLALYPGAPWKEGRWDVDHKPYATKFYAQFPRAALHQEGIAPGAIEPATPIA